MDKILAYIRINQASLPDYWSDCYVKETIHAVCNMLARSKRTYDEVAIFFECPVWLIRLIDQEYNKEITETNIEYSELSCSLNEILMDEHREQPPSEISDVYDLQNILDAIASCYT